MIDDDAAEARCDDRRDGPTPGVLHLIDPASAGRRATAALRFLLRRAEPGRRDTVVVVGPGGDGLDAFARVGAPLGRADLAWPAVRTLLGRWGRFDVIHAWSWRSATLAGAAAPSAPRVVNLFNAPTAGDVLPGPWLRGCGAALRGRGVVRARPTAAIFDGSHLAGLWKRHGKRWAAGVVAPLPCAVFEGGSRPDAAALRAAWGVTGEDFVVGIVGDPPDALDLHRALFAIGMAGASGRPMLAVAPRSGARTDRVALISRRLSPRWRMVFQAGGLGPALHACDAALWLGGMHGAAREVAPESLVEAMCAGVPLVVEDAPGSRSVCPDGACVRTPVGSGVSIAASLLRLYNDRDFARRLGADARAAATARTTAERWAGTLRALEGRAAGLASGPSGRRRATAASARS